MFEVNHDTNTVRMYGEIGGYFDGGISDQDVMIGLDDLGGRDITLQLNSKGGDVFQGLSIFNQLSHYAGKVTIEIDAIAASIASVIAMAGDEVAIHSNSMVMIHNPFTFAVGDAKEFRGVADLLEKIELEVANTYAAKTGKTGEHHLAEMAQDTYYTAEEALAEGLVDRIIKTEAKQTQSTASVAASAAFPARIAARMKLNAALLR